MKKIQVLLLSMVIAKLMIAQKIEDIRVERSIDLAATIGSKQGSVSGSYIHNWKLGKKQRWQAGTGLRWSTYLGSDQAFITAPAKYARTRTTPFLIFFAGQKTATQDTLTVRRPLTNSINLTINAGYDFWKKWSAGFNIDLIGVTFGKRSDAILTSNGQERSEPLAKPATFNLLLTGDHDRGSLNSEFFLRYRFNPKWSARAVYQFLFIEYKTTTVQQLVPDGTLIDRFRNKVNAFGIGVSYHLSKVRYM